MSDTPRTDHAIYWNGHPQADGVEKVCRQLERELHASTVYVEQLKKGWSRANIEDLADKLTTCHTSALLAGERVSDAGRDRHFIYLACIAAHRFCDDVLEALYPTNALHPNAQDARGSSAAGSCETAARTQVTTPGEGADSRTEINPVTNGRGNG